MRARSHHDVDRIRASVHRTRRLSDKIIGIGPFNLGIDGLMTWIPGVGAIYGLAAGGFLMVQAFRAHASPRTLAKMAGLLGADAVTDVFDFVPIAPAVVDMLFTGHKWAAEALMKGIDETVYYPGTRAAANADLRFQEVMERMRSGQDPRKRVVYLG